MNTGKSKLQALLLHDEKGSIIFIVSLLMTALLAISAFVVDFGMIYMKTSNIQNAADSAVLAAGRFLPIKSDDALAVEGAKQEAVLYAQKNGVNEISISDVTLGDLSDGSFKSVTVQITSAVQFYFAKAIGINSTTVSRSSQAKITPSTKIYAPNPLGVDITQLQNAIANNSTENIILKYGAGDTEASNGSFGAIDLDGVKGGGASDYASWLRYGFNGELSIGDNLLPVEKGDMAGPTYDALSERFNSCTHFPDQGGCTLEHYEPTCPRVLKVLVNEKVGTSYVKVKGFAAFILTAGTLETPGRIVGSYINIIEPGMGSGSGATQDIDFGVYNLSLSN